MGRMSDRFIDLEDFIRGNGPVPLPEPTEGEVRGMVHHVMTEDFHAWNAKAHNNRTMQRVIMASQERTRKLGLTPAFSTAQLREARKAALIADRIAHAALWQCTPEESAVIDFVSS